MKEILLKSYNRDALDYDRKFAVLQLAKYRALLGERGELFRNDLPSLDLGCGSGLLASFLGECGFDCSRLTGLDFSPELLKIAQTRLMNTLCHDLTGPLPFSENSFFQVFSFTVLCIIDYDLDSVLREVFRILAPGGSFFVTVLHRRVPLDWETTLTQCGFVVENMLLCGQDKGWICRKVQRSGAQIGLR